ncbi:uncharacterized protein [Euwallacea fornicatus]|uniref:uncharacterized protein n=1 Tax=Euwallacea fornicatus TaxID=995702 RepID=UPI00338E6F36
MAEVKQNILQGRNLITFVFYNPKKLFCKQRFFASKMSRKEINFPRYSFDNNTQKDLINFLQLAETHKQNSFCNHDEYRKLKSYFPLSAKIKHALNEHNSAPLCIDIDGSDEEEKALKATNHCKINQTLELPVSKDSDLVEIKAVSLGDLKETVKDCLFEEKSVPINLLQDLTYLSTDHLQDIFSYFAQVLPLDHIGSFWNSIIEHNITKNEVLDAFVSYCFIPKIKQRYCCEYSYLLKEISCKCGQILKTELIDRTLQTDWSDEEIPIIVQYLSTLGNDYKSDVLCDLIIKSDHLEQNYFPFIEVLLSPNLKDEILFQLIVLMASSSAAFSTDNTYGKLLFKVVKLFDKPMSGLEQPLKHILGSHESIWKRKVEKSVSSWFNDSLTQSFL